MKTAAMLTGVLIFCAISFGKDPTTRPAGPGAADPAHDRAARELMARLGGTWRLVATRQRMTDGTVRPDPDMGDRPVGSLMLDATAGRMCALLSNSDRPKWPDPATPTEAELRDIWNRMVAYAGPWSVDLARGELVYQMEINHSPNLVGTERRRPFTLNGDRLILRPTPLPPGVIDWEVEWQRSPELP